MDSALNEFSKQGYGASSVNTICAAEGISKGIIYHYFKTKDDLYLACVEECFLLLTGHLKQSISIKQGSIEYQLEDYFSSRTAFFQNHPIYQPIFCEAVVSPPAHLKEEIQLRKHAFDALNVEILEELLEPLPLRAQITKGEVIETFRQFQDFINAKCQMSGMDAVAFDIRDKSCMKALNILLYGVIDRKAN